MLAGSSPMGLLSTGSSGCPVMAYMSSGEPVVFQPGVEIGGITPYTASMFGVSGLEDRE